MAAEILTGSNNRTTYIGVPTCFCGALPTREGRCDYHAGMWAMFMEYQQFIDGETKDDTVDPDAFWTGYLLMQHLAHCEGFPELRDF